MDSIFKVRTVSPNLPGRIIRRERLLKKLAENKDKNLLIISSPAGYGKTTLIQDFLDYGKFDSGWLRISSDMDNLYAFAGYLISSLKNIHKDFGINTAQVIEICKEKYKISKNLKTIVNDITGTFTNEFYSLFKEEVILVLDDLGMLGNSEWLILFLNTLLENIPSNFHIIITTREVPEINISTLYAKRKIFKLETDDLTFNRSETEELLENVYGISYSESEINLLESNLGGWITGIHLILQTWGKNFAKLKLYNETVLEDIFNFFAEDIFKNLDVKVQNFLLDTALIENFTSAASDQILKISGSKLILDLLQSKNIFLQVNPNVSEAANEITYNYQVLFKKFLISKLYALRTTEEIESTLKRVYEHYISENDYSKAVNYALLCKDHRFVIELIIEKSPEVIESGKMEVLWRWLESINENILENSPALLYYKSRVLNSYFGEFEKSLIFTDKALLLLEKTEDPQLKYRCLTHKARNLQSLGRIKEAISILKKLKTLTADSENKANSLYLLAYSFSLISEYDNSLKLLEEALNICIENNIKEVQTHIYNRFGHIYLIRGDYNKAVLYYEKAVQSTHNINDKHETLCNLILLHSQTGNFEEARELLISDEELISRIPIPIFKITFLVAHQAFAFEYGDYESALNLLEQMHSIASKINHKYYIYLSRVLTADTYYYLNMLAKAEEFYELAFSYIDEENIHEKNQYAFMKALLIKKENFEMQDKVPLASVENVLIEIYEYYRDNKFVYESVHAAFHLADFYLKQGLLNSAVQYLVQCLKISKDKEYVSYLQREFMDSRIVFDFAIANNVEKDFVKSIVESVITKNEADWISEGFKKRFESKLHSYYDVSVFTFNRLEFMVRGKLIAESEWRKKKWKHVLLYLFLSSKEEITKDKIIDIFYPDTNVESVDNIFHQLVSKLRSLFKIEIMHDKVNEAKQSTKKSISKNGTKAGNPEIFTLLQLISYEDKVLKFNKDFTYYSDIDNFEKIYKKSKSETNRLKKIEYAKKSISLYTGEFLEGIYEFWSEDTRSKAKSDFISISEELIVLLFNLKLYNEVVHYSENLLSHEKINETAYLYCIKSLVELKKISNAKEKFAHMLKSYQSELGEKPPQKTLNELQKILITDN